MASLILGKAVQLLHHNYQNHVSLLTQQVRHMKHWNPKFKRLRGLKVAKVELPNFDEERNRNKMSPDEIKARMKEKGILPHRQWLERPTFISSTGGVFEPYVPPEGDGKLSAISVSGAKQNLEFVSKKGKSMMAVRKIRQFDDDFEPKEFAQLAQEIYLKAHEALMKKNTDTLHETVTEKAYPEMTWNTQFTTIRWQFINSVEPPRVVHARCTDVISKENIFAQITVRFHTQQTLAIYDRFGRLMHGSEVVVKDVLEYVVFEKHMANTYGKWRIHDKIIPDWMPPKQPATKTYVKPAEPPPQTESAVETVATTEANNSPPAVAVA
uniref:Large ribosomal subunit protein mL45 n=1 Tax=Lynceus sp. MCZ IZ 141354 TaxID=1930659 RepID=A0A9N6ZFR6_9CRUS|nr:EOG090X0DDP [Lynceus sp. MCZ IZ 141354]